MDKPLQNSIYYYILASHFEQQLAYRTVNPTKHIWSAVRTPEQSFQAKVFEYGVRE